MKRTLWAIVVATLFCSPSIAKADFTIEVFASSAPNFFGSASWSGYASNAMNSLENDLGDIGDRSIDPTAYLLFVDDAYISIHNLIVTDFSSWLGVANEPAPFDNESGNRLHFGLHITSDGVSPFRMEDIRYEISSDDGNSLGHLGDLSGSNYSSVRIGIDYGGDNAKGGGDDTIINSGAGTQFIDEFIYVGVGNAFDASSSPGPSDQEKINQTISDNISNAPILITGEYFLDDTSGNPLGSGTTSITVVPEPASAILIALGFVSFLSRRRMHSARTQSS